jgi:hypothetical protein
MPHYGRLYLSCFRWPALELICIFQYIRLICVLASVSLPLYPLSLFPSVCIRLFACIRYLGVRLCIFVSVSLLCIRLHLSIRRLLFVYLCIRHHSCVSVCTFLYKRWFCVQCILLYPSSSLCICVFAYESAAVCTFVCLCIRLHGGVSVYLPVFLLLICAYILVSVRSSLCSRLPLYIRLHLSSVFSASCLCLSICLCVPCSLFGP